MTMRETEELGQIIDDEAEESKIPYQRPVLRRVGLLRDVTAQASLDTQTG
jgi:hypothetical protein